MTRVVMSVDEVFRFADGSTVFVGKVHEGPAFIGPCDVELMIDGVPRGLITLTGERTSGRAGLRAVQTRSPVDLDVARAGECELIGR